VSKRGVGMNQTSAFLYVLRLARLEAFEKMSPKEEAIIDEHFEYLKRKLAEKKLVLAGPCLDGKFGIVIFRAESEKEAEEFMKNDPAVRSRVMAAELHPFRVSLIEKA
jgi:uncharacterized protein YciI